MVVTCPSCSARYRLNPDKMKGRGAKITCPKCSHVFVVFADGASGSASDPLDPSGDEVDALLQEDTLRERLLKRDRSTTSSAMKAIGVDDDVDANLTSSEIRVVAPGPRGSRKAVATLDTTQGLPGEDGEDGEDGEGWSGPEILDANTLDFREVGIATWKVKVAIGLVYDFSDIATLKRYLDDKKVTAADLISHNGKDWTKIGDIPSLDQHFIETWKVARAERKDQPLPKPKKATSTGSFESTGNFQTSTGRMGALSPSGRHQTVRTSTKRRKSKKPQKKAPSSASKVGPLLAGLVVVGLLGAYFLRPGNMSGGGVDGAGSGAAAGEQELGEKPDEKARIKEEIERAGQEYMAKEKAEMAASRAAEVKEERDPNDITNYVPVRPEDASSSAAAASLSEKRAPTPKRSPAVAKSGGLRMQSPSARGGGSSSTTLVQKDKGGKMWEEKGNEALAKGNFGFAETCFEKCTAKNSKAGSCWAGLGKARERLGDMAGAKVANDKARALGAPVDASSP